MPDAPNAPPSPVQPPPRRVGPVLAPPAGAPVAGQGRGPGRRDAGGVRTLLLPVSGQRPGERPEESRLHVDARLRQRLPGASAGERSRPDERKRPPDGGARDGTVSCHLFLAAPRPDPRRDVGNRDPTRGRGVGRRDESHRRRPGRSLRPGLREQGRPHGMLQSPPPLPGLGDGSRAAPPGAQARDPARLFRAPGSRPGRRLSRARGGSGGTDRVPQRPLGRACSVVGGVAVRDHADSGAPSAGHAVAPTSPSETPSRRSSIA